MPSRWRIRMIIIVLIVTPPRPAAPLVNEPMLSKKSAKG